MAGTITHYWDGTKLVVTSDSGTSACDLKGAQGDMGVRGCQGEPGIILFDEEVDKKINASLQNASLSTNQTNEVTEIATEIATEKVANASLSQSQFDEVLNMIGNASLSMNQFDEVLRMIENTPVSQEKLNDAGAVLLNGSAWGTTQIRIEALENQAMKLYRIRGIAYENCFYVENGEREFCRFEAVVQNPNAWAQDFLWTLAEDYQGAGVVSFRLYRAGANSFCPIGYTRSDGSTLYGFKNGQFYEGADYGEYQYAGEVMVRDVEITELYTEE